MKRVMIIGNCGSGKSTLAFALHAKLGLELIHLDQHYWKPNWQETPKPEWEEKVAKLAAKESWIIDGNYGSSMNTRIQRADTIIYLNYPTLKCLYRVIQRIRKYHGQVRPDMPEGCRERFDIDFLHFVAVYNITRRKSTLAKLEKAKVDKDVFVLSSDEEVREFLSKANQREQYLNSLGYNSLSVVSMMVYSSMLTHFL